MATTRFERDYALASAMGGDEIEIIERRRAELRRIEREGRACRNGFRRQCLALEYTLRKSELDAIEDLF